MTDNFINQVYHGDWIDVAHRLPDKCIHTVITSPPYWGQRNYGVEGQLGLEKTPEEHIEKLVVGFREMRRILRDDGTLWVNYGDKFWGGKGQSASAWSASHPDRATFEKEHHHPAGPNLGETRLGDGKHDILKAGDLMGLAWRLALVMQADGWILRDDIIWAKAISSFGMHTCPHCDGELYQEIDQGEDLFGDEIDAKVISHKKSGTTMPESMNGWRWEQHRVTQCPQCGALASFRKKVCKSCGYRRTGERATNPYQEGAGTKQGPGLGARAQREEYFDKGIGAPPYVDCPGCPKCEANDGLVLREGSWRPTRAHEYLLQFAKTGRYFCDAEAVKEENSLNTHDRGTKLNPPKEGVAGHADWTKYCPERNMASGRNLRDVWTINPQPCGRAHYATFPEKLIEPIIRVATSEKGCCPKCGAPWARIIRSKQVKRERPADSTDRHNQGQGVNSCGNTVAGVECTTLGWRATCQCGIEETVPAVCYDPFMGSGTVAAVAARLGRNYCGSELNESYLNDQARLRIAAAEHGMGIEEVEQGQKTLFK